MSRQTSHGWLPGPARTAVLVVAAMATLMAVIAMPEASLAASGLVAAYGFDEVTGSATADASGGANTGTITGATRSTAGKFGGALSFDGTSTWVTVPDAAALRLSTGMTMEAWVRPTSSSGWRTVLMKERTGGMSYGLYGYDNSAKPPAAYGNFSGTDAGAYGTSALPLNTWSHLASTYDGTTLKLYVNGVASGSLAKKGSLTSSTSPLRIGGNSIWGEYFAGLIDEVRIYNRALPAAEIQADMTTSINAQAPDTTPPVITAVTTAAVSSTGATITWTTDESSTNQVDYGLSTDYGSTATAAGSSTAHSVSLTGVNASSIYHYRVRSADAAGNSATSADATFTTSVADTTPPTVTITAPSDGSSLSGTVTLNATSGDDVGVAAVQFLADGATIGTEDTTTPYSVSWNTTTAGQGAHTLTAKARDTSGNTTVSAPVAVTVNNSDPRSAAGSWGPVTGMGDIAQQAVLMTSGNVLFYKDGAGARVLNPVSGAISSVPLSRSDLFCAGQGVLPDGRLLINGGQSHTGSLGIADNNIFDPVTQNWSVSPNMTYKRWYPTMTPLADGKQLSTSGSQETVTDIAPIPELFDPAAGTWKTLPSATNPIPYYPFMYQLPNGRIAMIGATEQATDTQVLDPKTWTWTTVDPALIDGGSSVQYAPGKFLKAGTSSDGNTPVRPSSAAAYVIDMNQPSPAWRAVAPMAYPRAFLNLTLLPDGTVLATGGETTADGVNAANAVSAAEVWDPNTEKWTTLSSSTGTPRLYHSIGLLLPDGRVMVSGGGNDAAVPNSPNYEMYSPPYLFKGTRPAVTSAPSTIDYGSSFVVATPDAADIASVRLIRPAAVTHSFDSNAATIPLSFTPTAGGLQVQAPADANTAVPGHYLLFIVNKKGVPAVAPFTRLPAPWEDKVAPAAPSALTGTGGLASAALSWSAATDNNAVTGYRVYRAAAAGVAPSAATRVGTPAQTSFSDSGLAAGTYYYVVTAVDGAGNEGPPSNEISVTATADTTAPAVTVTAPGAGATVSGSVTLTASASDNVKVSGVRFLIDGTALGATIATAPYSAAWSSTLVANGTHTITAEATDSSGNRATDAVTVTVSNAAASGLVAAYGMNEGNGSAVGDASGNGNAGVLTGGSWSSTGKFGGALSMDGTSSWVTVADKAPLRLTTGMTIEAWVRPSATSGWRNVIMKERPGGMSYALYAYDNSAKPPAVYGNSGGADTLAKGTAALATGTWTHLAGTYDGTTLRMFVNGVQVGTKAFTGSLQSSTSPLRIGGDSAWGEYFAGLVDEVRIYNRALPAAEIQADMTKAV